MNSSMQVSPLDCLGCGVCVDVCPAKKKALEYEADRFAEGSESETGSTLARNSAEEKLGLPDDNVKDSQFRPAVISNFPAHVQVAEKLLMSKAHHAAVRRKNDDRQRYRMFLHLGRICIRLRRIRRTVKAEDLHGATLCLRTTQSSVSVWLSRRSR